MNKVSKDILYELYTVKGMPMHEIASKLEIAIGTVYNYLKKYEIQTRSRSESFDLKRENGWTYPTEAREKISQKHKGKKYSEETRHKMSESAKLKGVGHKKVRKDGYISIYFPDHPKSNKEGYIMEHILVMECVIGRWLEENEVVHHINGNRQDNRKENLQLMTSKEHARFHMKKRWEEKKKGGMTY